MQSNRKVALAVDSEWYRALQSHKFLQGAQWQEHPTDVLVGTVDSEDAIGVWIKPDERFSEFSKASLLVPWRYIVSAVHLGPDEEQKMLGFLTQMPDSVK
jgi:hypothetical protein